MEEISKPINEFKQFESIRFPIGGDKRLTDSIDLRLPHNNPLLSEFGPLHAMRDDVLRIFAENHFVAFPVLLGSSGVGKTTVAFMVCEYQWCVFMEAAGSLSSDGIGYELHVDTLLWSKANGVAADLVDISRRTWREILARTLVLVALKCKFEDITPYEGLLFQLSPEMQEPYNRVIEELGTGYSIADMLKLLRECNRFLTGSGASIAIIIDEAHLLNDNPHLQFNDSKINTYQAVLIALSQMPFAGVLSAGTQVCLGQVAKLASAVAKIQVSSKAFVFDKFPVLEGYESTSVFSVRASLLKCIPNYDIVAEDNRRMIENDLSGRPRFVSSFVLLYFKHFVDSKLTNHKEEFLLESWHHFCTWYCAISARQLQIIG